jgi:hypothetical protein
MRVDDTASNICQTLLHGLAPLLPTERRYRRNTMAIANTAGVSPSDERGSTG